MPDPIVHVAVCGHVRHGKSTLSGRVAVELEAISAEQLEDYALMAADLGGRFNKYSIIFLDERPPTFINGEASDASRTVFPVRGSLKLGTSRLTLIDTPGHKKWFDNLVYGVFLSHVAIVVVEAEIDPIGRSMAVGTDAVCRVLTAFEVPVILFCVTKMDTIGYSQEGFESVRDNVIRPLLEKYNLGVERPVIPVAALSESGEGVLPPSADGETLMPWYRGPYLLDSLRTLPPVSLAGAASPTRITVQGRYEILSPRGKGTVILGKLEYGTVSAGDILIAQPASNIDGEEYLGKVVNVHIARTTTEAVGEAVQSIEAPAFVAVLIRQWSRDEANQMFKHGGMLGPPAAPPTVATKIRAQLFFFSTNRVYKGKQYKIQPHGAWVMGTFSEIERRTPIDLENAPSGSAVGVGEAIEATLSFDRPGCIEPSDKFKRLSRFALSERNSVVACGKCIEVLE